MRTNNTPQIPSMAIHQTQFIRQIRYIKTNNLKLHKVGAMTLKRIPLERGLLMLGITSKRITKPKVCEIASEELAYHLEHLRTRIMNPSDKSSKRSSYLTTTITH